MRDLLLSGSGPITGPTGALSPITAYEQRLVAPTEATPEMPEHQVWFWLLMMTPLLLRTASSGS